MALCEYQEMRSRAQCAMPVSAYITIGVDDYDVVVARLCDYHAALYLEIEEAACGEGT